ncbi:MAG TPA: hypothetical protein VLK33_10350, partial [Terriglobales bacterium]|nr:hypothetical protein [Terriglobales bacterium]
MKLPKLLWRAVLILPLVLVFSLGSFSTAWALDDPGYCHDSLQVWTSTGENTGYCDYLPGTLAFSISCDEALHTSYREYWLYDPTIPMYFVSSECYTPSVGG